MRSLALGLFFFQSAFATLHPIFQLDKKWQIVDPRKLNEKHIDYMFLKSGKSIAGLRLVMAHESISGSLNDYLAACVKLNNETPGSTARRLGPYTTKWGVTGELLQIESDGVFGKMSTVQLITLAEQTAHILTITTDKKSFLKEQEELMAIFDSLALKENPLDDLPPKIASALTDSIDQMRVQVASLAARRAQLARKELPNKALLELQARLITQWRDNPLFKERLWPSFAKLIEKHFESYGPVWQLEALKYCAERLLEAKNQAFK